MVDDRQEQQDLLAIRQQLLVSLARVQSEINQAGVAELDKLCARAQTRVGATGAEVEELR